LFAVVMLSSSLLWQGCEEAGDRIATLEVFKNAQNIKVDPDKPLQQARYATLKVRDFTTVPRIWSVSFIQPFELEYLSAHLVL